MTDIEKQVVAERIFHQTWKLYQESLIGGYLASKNIKLPQLTFICKGIGAAGRYYGYGMVEINTAYYQGGCTKNLEETIAHELAHHLQRKIYPNATQWHGPEFRFIMSAIGYNGDTYHRMSKVVAKQTAARSKYDLFEF